MHLPRSIRNFFFAVLLLVLPAASFAGVFVSITVAPPVLPVYVQPACPGDGYIWTPGYWAYGPDGYYWVPGTWVLAPRPGFLWTPGYWGWGGGFYAWHAGYWGPHIGFYGGVNYGFGYGGVGFVGGHWDHDRFFYNTAVSNVNVTVIHNTYRTTVINNTTIVNRTSFNGPGGINARASVEEERASHESHLQATSVQMQHEHFASTNHAYLASVNHGRPAEAAMSRPMTHDRSTNVPRPGGAPRPQNQPHPTTVSDRRSNGGNVPRPSNAGQPHGNQSYANQGQTHNAPPHDNHPQHAAQPHDNGGSHSGGHEGGEHERH